MGCINTALWASCWWPSVPRWQVMSERSVPAEQIGNDICQEPWLSRAQRERYQGLWALLLVPAGETSSVLCSPRVSSHLYSPCTPPITGSSVSARLSASVIMCSVVSVSSYMKLEQNLLLITTSFCSHLKCMAHLMLMLSGLRDVNLSRRTQ